MTAEALGKPEFTHGKARCFQRAFHKKGIKKKRGRKEIIFSERKRLTACRRLSVFRIQGSFEQGVSQIKTICNKFMNSGESPPTLRYQHFPSRAVCYPCSNGFCSVAERFYPGVPTDSALPTLSVTGSVLPVLEWFLLCCGEFPYRSTSGINALRPLRSQYRKYVILSGGTAGTEESTHLWCSMQH